MRPLGGIWPCLPGLAIRQQCVSPAPGHYAQMAVSRNGPACAAACATASFAASRPNVATSHCARSSKPARASDASPATASGWWEAHDIRDVPAGRKLLHHPVRGPELYESATFQANADPALKLAIYTRVAGGVPLR